MAVGVLVTSKAHTNFTSTLKESQSQEEFVKRLKALPRHAVDDHSQCDFHALVVCSCSSSKAREDIKCQGKTYKTRLRLDCKFHALHCKKAGVFSTLNHLHTFSVQAHCIMRSV